MNGARCAVCCFSAAVFAILLSLVAGSQEVLQASRFRFPAVPRHSVKRISMCSPPLSVNCEPVTDDLLRFSLLSCSSGIQPSRQTLASRGVVNANLCVCAGKIYSCVFGGIGNVGEV